MKYRGADEVLNTNSLTYEIQDIVKDLLSDF